MLLLLYALAFSMLTFILIRQLFCKIFKKQPVFNSLTITHVTRSQQVHIRNLGNKRSQSETDNLVELIAVKRLKLEQSSELTKEEKMKRMQALYCKMKILEQRYTAALAAHQKVLIEEREFLAQLCSKYQKPFGVSLLEG